MKYMGSKARIAKYILPIMLAERKEGQTWVEPFVGGGNMIERVSGPRIGADVNPYIIALLNGTKSGLIEEMGYIPKELYDRVRDNKDKYDNFTVGYVGFVCSVNGKFFNGFSGICNTKDGIRNYQEESRRALIKSRKPLHSVEFHCCDYASLNIPARSIIYCDPPYRGTTRYRDVIDYEMFYRWCRSMSRLGHNIFISEYSMPDDFICIWEQEVTCALSTTKTYKPIEKLFTL